MQVRLKVGLSGTRNGVPWPGIGETVELPDHEAAEFCAAGLAEPVRSNTTEKAVDERPVENRDQSAAKEQTSDEVDSDDESTSRRRGRPRKDA